MQCLVCSYFHEGPFFKTFLLSIQKTKDITRQQTSNDALFEDNVGPPNTTYLDMYSTCCVWLNRALLCDSPFTYNQFIFQLGMLLQTQTQHLHEEICLKLSLYIEGFL